MEHTWVQLDNFDSCHFRCPDVTGLKGMKKMYVINIFIHIIPSSDPILASVPILGTRIGFYKYIIREVNNQMLRSFQNHIQKWGKEEFCAYTPLETHLRTEHANILTIIKQMTFGWSNQSPWKPHQWFLI